MITYSYYSIDDWCWRCWRDPLILRSPIGATLFISKEILLPIIMTMCNPSSHDESRTQSFEPLVALLLGAVRCHSQVNRSRRIPAGTVQIHEHPKGTAVLFLEKQLCRSIDIHT